MIKHQEVRQMRIIHTADWHIGRLFHGVNLLEDQQYVLENFIALIKESRPDVILISGDVYDRALPPGDAVRLFGEVLTRISRDSQVPVIIIAGNHDHPERLSYAQGILSQQQVYTVGALNDFFRPIIIEDSFGPVYFCPIPFAEPSFAREYCGEDNIRDQEGAMAALTKKITAAIPRGKRKIALAHAMVLGGEVSESERPLTVVGGAGAVSLDSFRDFDYVALGHLHRPQSMGQSSVRYAGSLLKYSFSEVNHKKSVTLLEIDGEGKMSHLEEMPLGCRREMHIIKGRLPDLLESTPAGVEREDYIKAILMDEGALLDPMGKLRVRYPNILELERPQFTAILEQGRPTVDHRKMTDGDLFFSFFEQVGGGTLSEEGKDRLNQVLDDHNRRERGL
jgi:exonuclease SbcD